MVSEPRPIFAEGVLGGVVFPDSDFFRAATLEEFCSGQAKSTGNGESIRGRFNGFSELEADDFEVCGLASLGLAVGTVFFGSGDP